MKKNTVILIVIVAILALSMVGVYNSMVSADENVTKTWADVEAQYQRRMDLIPNLVNTVKGYASHEQETLESVVAARSRATQVTVDPENLTPEAIAEYNKAQGEVGAAIGRLLMIQENYPDLKANENFRDLQSQLEGTENRIAVARNRFNESVQNYNIKIRRFPQNIMASLFGFDKKSPFEATEGADVAPVVEF